MVQMDTGTWRVAPATESSLHPRGRRRQVKDGGAHEGGETHTDCYRPCSFYREGWGLGVEHTLGAFWTASDLLFT